MLKLKANGYIDKGNLYIVGVANTQFGTVPFTHKQPINGKSKDGPIIIGLEQRNPAVEKAIIKSRNPIRIGIEKEKIKSAIEGLIERSRQGDQNAIGMLCQVRKNAKKSKRANYSYGYAVNYVKSRPISDLGIVTISGLPVKTSNINSIMGALKKSLNSSKNNTLKYVAAINSNVANIPATLDNLRAAGVAVADATRLTPLILQQVQKQNSKTYVDGYAGKKWNDKSSKVGFVIGYAKRLQDIRNGSSVQEFSPKAAWELGETVTSVKKPITRAGSSSYYDAGGSRPPIPDSIRAKNISKMGISPSGYRPFYNKTVPAGVTSKCIELLKQDFGYEEYATIDGLKLFFRVEPHYHPQTYVGGPHGWHKGCTTYQAVQITVKPKVVEQPVMDVSQIALAMPNVLERNREV